MSKTTLEFLPRYYELALDGSLPPHSLCNYFQEAAGVDAHNLNFGREEGIAWAIVRMQMEMGKKYSGKDAVTIQTWHAFSDKITSRREFEIKDKDGNVLMKGSTWWIILDLNTRKITRTPEFLLQRNKENPDFVLEEGNFKAKLPEGLEPVAVKEFAVRLEDIDINGHVNNTHYMAWAMESMPANIRAEKTLKNYKIIFKQECVDGDKVIAKIYDTGNGVYFHELVREDGKEVVRVISEWA
ncbi:acyl-ACP thioesterase [Elusimicrobium simillimum]|uniref:acyl-[acyl-carrier-protein] thioesterase n=1 Tax=Elusimicrobium simillimum TaxID=3143438 RepID=UPI003C6EDF5F